MRPGRIAPLAWSVQETCGRPFTKRWHRKNLQLDQEAVQERDSAPGGTRTPALRLRRPIQSFRKIYASQRILLPSGFGRGSAFQAVHSFSLIFISQPALEAAPGAVLFLLHGTGNSADSTWGLKACQPGHPCPLYDGHTIPDLLMPDVFTAAVRSRIMSAVRSRNTYPERVVRSFLHRDGLRFRLHKRGLPGSPDIVLSKYSAIIFVHGCFWHQHRSCRYSGVHVPSSNRSYWAPKLARNVARDSENRKALETIGWRVKVIWECEISAATLEALADWVRARSANSD